ncbi:hypothetical protein EG329_010934 [Mollisiaceae sp. DMI_Dod_QoI]|nr:hypothetical protein EG329_010934 [Helotiales sp. DMI_Dod_QoI]
MSYPTLYFGVELEFNIAYVHPYEALADPFESRIVRFIPTPEQITTGTSGFFDKPLTSIELFDLSNPDTSMFRNRIMRNTIHNTIRETFATAGLPIAINVDDSTYGDISKWELDTDGTIEEPPDARYHWLPLELISPAYEFTPENLAAVQKACDILTTKFVTNTNNSTGLHVHVSFGLKKMWDFRSLKNVLMFFWAFHTQFDTLHPTHRQKDNFFAKSMRASSLMSMGFWERFQKEITPLQGLVLLERCEDMDELLRAVSTDEGDYGVGPDRYMVYNVRNIFDLMTPGMLKEKAKPTLEFREHEGTLDGERVTQWIKLVCEVVKWVETVEPASLIELLMVTEHEKWHKTRNEGDDDRNQRKYGPILAEGKFTIIHILEYMGLQESADFYRSRLYKVTGHASLDPVDQYKWTHEEPRLVLSEIERPEQAIAQGLKEVWEDMEMMARFNKPSEEWTWNPDHQMWPAHRRIRGF